MRRVAALSVVLMLGVFIQRAGSGTSPGASVTLAMGFALIAAVLVAELVERVSLPRVTGYLLLGMVCGPYMANLITQSMARELRLFNGLAVALIAFIAGLEMNLSNLRPRLAAITRIGLTTLAIMYGVLYPVLWLAWPWLPIAPEAAGAARAAYALVLSVVVISFSPTVTIAVITESRARGPFSELVLAVVIFADLVLILSFTFAMQFATWASGARAAQEVGVAAHLMWEVIGSFAFGAALGAVFALYLRLVGREVTLALLGLCGAFAVVGQQLQFEHLLAALAAGLVVENIAPPRGDALRQAVERGALPVIVVFFAAAGASLHLDALGELGSIAVLIAVLRIASIRLGTKIGGGMAPIEVDQGRSLWMGLVSQAGVTLGLAMIVATQYPSWGGRMQTLIVALIAIHEVIGPVLFRAALARAGEIGRMDALEEARTSG